MKLLACRSCGDMVLMRPEPRSCFCGKRAYLNPLCETDVRYVEPAAADPITPTSE